MRKHIILAAGLAAALAAPLGPALASQLELCFGDGPFCIPDPAQEDRSSTNFDLGVDVSGIPATKKDVAEFLATLTPGGQQIMMRTCQHYLDSSSRVQSPYTLPFCRVVVGR